MTTTEPGLHASRRSTLFILVIVAIATFLPLLQAHRAAAHPLGNFTINRYARLELYRGAVHIHYVVDMAEIPTYQLVGDIDTDKNGTASQSELDAYASKERNVLASKFRLTVSGKRIDTAPAETTIQLLAGQAGLNTLRLSVVYVATIDQTDEQRPLAFNDSNYNERAGWKEILVVSSPGSIVTVDPKFTVDRSDALRSYPAETLASAPDVREVAFTWASSSGAEPPLQIIAQIADQGRSASGVAGAFSDLLKHDRSVSFILLSILIAFLFGAQHALGPGHGKTMVAAYLVGTKGTPRQAVVLGFTVTATHTSTVYLMGAVALLAASYVATETVQLWMGVIVGLLVVGFGGVLFVNRLRKTRDLEAAAKHRHGLFGRGHSHAPESAAVTTEPDQPHAQADPAAIPSKVGQVHDAAHHHHREDEPAGDGVSWRSVFSLGFLGGLLPCPSAVVVMLGAIAQGQVLLGMLLIVAFSLGLALVLTTIGIGLTLTKKVGARQRAFFNRPVIIRLAAAMPVISALVVMLAGAIITYQALQQAGV